MQQATSAAPLLKLCHVATVGQFSPFKYYRMRFRKMIMQNEFKTDSACADNGHCEK